VLAQQDLYTGTVIVIFVVEIYGLWKYLIVPLQEGVMKFLCGIGGIKASTQKRI